MPSSTVWWEVRGLQHPWWLLSKSFAALVHAPAEARRRKHGPVFGTGAPPISESNLRGRRGTGPRERSSVSPGEEWQDGPAVTCRRLGRPGRPGFWFAPTRKRPILRARPGQGKVATGAAARGVRLSAGWSRATESSPLPSLSVVQKEA